MSSIDESKKFIPLDIAVLTISDSRTLADDKSGTTLAERLTAAGHRLAAREIVTDDVEAIRAVVKRWIADSSIDVVITTGGTGFTGRDVTPEAVEPLFEKRMDGFSIAFHMLSHAKIGTSTIQSRATAGVAGATFIFCLPGRMGRHSLSPARLPHAAVQFRRDHAAARRASAPAEGEGGVCVRPSAPAHDPRQCRPHGAPHVQVGLGAQLMRPPLVECHQFRRHAARSIAPRPRHSSRSQVSPIRLWPKLRCGSVAIRTKPAS